jgi:hypothetical protein
MLLQELIPDAPRLFVASPLTPLVVSLIRSGTVRQRIDVLRQMEGRVHAMASTPPGCVPHRRPPRYAWARNADARECVCTAGDAGRAAFLCQCLHGIDPEELAMVWDELAGNVVPLLDSAPACTVLIAMLRNGNQERTVCICVCVCLCVSMSLCVHVCVCLCVHTYTSVSTWKAGMVCEADAAEASALTLGAGDR